MVDFLAQRAFHAEFPGAAMPGYGRVSVRWLKAWQYYRAKTNEYRGYMQRKGA